MKNSKLIKFIFVGILNTVFGYSIFAFFIFCNLHYTIASLLSTVIGVLFNFKTTGNLVFKNKDNTLLGKFILVYMLIYLLNIISLKLLENFYVDIYISGAILMFPLALLSFLLNNRFVFQIKTTKK